MFRPPVALQLLGEMAPFPSVPQHGEHEALQTCIPATARPEAQKLLEGDLQPDGVTVQLPFLEKLG